MFAYFSSVFTGDSKPVYRYCVKDCKIRLVFLWKCPFRLEFNYKKDNQKMEHDENEEK